MRSIFVRLVTMLTWAAITQTGPNDATPVATRKALTLVGAKQVMTAAMAQARKGAGTGVIAIVDEGGNLMCVERLDGTFAAGANISIGKARTAALFKKPTRAFEEIIK